MKQLQIKLVRSLIGYPETQRSIVHALGLRKLQHTVIRPDVASVRGMVNKISHLVECTEIDA